MADKANKKIVQEIASQAFSNSKEFKNQAITIKKIVSGIEKQQKYLSKYLKPRERSTLAKAAHILAEYVTVFNNAAKENEKQAKAKTAKWEKEGVQRLDSMTVQDFGDLSSQSVMAECKLLQAYLEMARSYPLRLKEAIKRYESNASLEKLQQIKLCAVYELEQMATYLNKNKLQEFKQFKLSRLNKKI